MDSEWFLRALDQILSVNVQACKPNYRRNTKVFFFVDFQDILTGFWGFIGANRALESTNHI